MGSNGLQFRPTKGILQQSENRFDETHANGVVMKILGVHPIAPHDEQTYGAARMRISMASASKVAAHGARI
jgi:hypothetical protein